MANLNRVDNFYTLKMRNKKKTLMGVMYDEDINYPDILSYERELDLLEHNRFSKNDNKSENN